MFRERLDFLTRLKLDSYRRNRGPVGGRRTQPIDELMDTYRDITFQDALDNDLKRENANIDANTPMGAMLKYGSEGSKYYVAHYILPADIAQAHLSGDIHIHDMDFYMLTETCCQIDLLKLFSKGFSTGHGHLRRPNSIQSYAALACIAIQANQNDMHGGQAIPNFELYPLDGGQSATLHGGDVHAWMTTDRKSVV